MKSRKEKDDTKRTLIIDCSTIIYAAFHTMGGLSYEGMETGIIYGFLKKVLSLSKRFNTSNFIFCWDHSKNYRTVAYKNYKKKRRLELTPEEKDDKDVMLAQSMELQWKLLSTIGFMNSFIQSGYEADDIIAYWVNKLHDKRDLIVISSDSDLYQLLDRCSIFNLSSKKVITKKTFKDKYNIEPSEWAMAKAIGGCSTDEVKGIKGASDPKNPKSKALKYIRGELTEGKIYDKIKSRLGQRRIEKNLPLVTIPYEQAPVAMKRFIWRRDRFSREGMIETFDKYHFKSFLSKDNFSEWESAFLGGWNGY